MPATSTGRGAQVILTGQVRRAARGSAANTLVENSRIKADLERAGLISDGSIPDGRTYTGGPAHDVFVVAPEAELDATFGSQPVTATGGTVPRTLADRFAETVNVKDFGAKGDGTTDDTAAINAALNFVRSFPLVSGFDRPFRLVFPYGRYLVTAPLNFTGLKSISGGVIDGQGSTIIAKMSGVVIDCLGSRWLRFRDLTVYGDPTTTPKIGIQIGRIANGISADYHTFINVEVFGCFTLAAHLNFASETCSYYTSAFRNDLTTADKYCMILDGVNHWNVTSTFVTQTCALNTPQSFIGDLFVGCTWQGNASNGVVWLGNVSLLKMIDCYASCPAGWIFTVYSLTGTAPSLTVSNIECHCETAGLKYCFMFTGAAGVTFNWVPGFAFKDHSAFGEIATFGIDPASSIALVELRNAEIHAPNFIAGAKLFDQPSKYSIRKGNVDLSTVDQWVEPAYWQGSVSFHNAAASLSFNTLNKWTTATRPVAPAGSIGYATDTTRIEAYNGTTWNSFTQLSGDTMSGPLAVPNLLVAGPVATDRGVSVYTGSGAPGLRWKLSANSIAESGSNLGSDLVITAYSDTGVALSFPLSINRYNGQVSVPGPVSIGSSIFLAVPATKTGTAYTLATADCSLILNPSGTFTLSLQNPVNFPGRILFLKLIAAFAVNSSAGNVVPLAGGSAGTVIMPATAGKFCKLQSDGTNWQIMEAN